MAPPFSWLHLTDFHYGLKGQDCLWPTLREPFFQDLEALHARTGPWQAVLFTGDLVQAGTSAQFAEMQREVLDRLWTQLRKLGSGEAVLLAVPGNHDLFRPDPEGDNPAVDTLLRKDGFREIAARFWSNPAGAYRRVVTDAFAAYTGWWNGTPQRPKIQPTPGILPGDFACTLPCGEHRIGIIGLNTAFLQLQGGDFRERLVWHASQLHAVCGGAVDDWLNQHHVCLLLTHQGPEWLTPDARTHGESEIAPAGRFAAHLFGHMHEARIVYLRQGGGENAVRLIQGPSVFGMEAFGEPPQLARSHGYAAGRIDFTKKGATLRVWPRRATNKNGPWRFIPDYEHIHLENDQGTRPEPIAVRSLATPATGSATPRRAVRSRRQAGSAAQAPGAAPLTPHATLPTRRPFFGRDKELLAIARILQPEHVGWGVVLDGPGGMGKTALAIEAAHRAPVEHYPLKIFITAKARRLDPSGEHELQDHRVGDFHALLSEIGLALGREDIPRAAPDERPDLVRHALATHRALLVLDNLESFTPKERRRLYDLLEALPRNCRAIVTSRRRDETAARTLRLDKLEPDAASQLLVSLGEQWAPVARLTADERQRLYAETGGNPLLLAWTAGQLGRTTGRCRTVDDAIARLQEAHRRQKVNEKNDPLEFIFGDLLDTFTDDETAVLAALAHFSEPAHVDWLLPLAAISETAALNALDDLRDRALLIEDEVSGTWLLPPLAARFLRQRRHQAVGDAGERLAGEAYALALQHGYTPPPFTELEAAWPTIQAALPLLIAGDNGRLQEVCSALSKFLEGGCFWDELLSLFQQAEAKASAAGDSLNAGWRAAFVGWIHFSRGDVEAVQACARRCDEHWRQAGAEEWAVARRLRRAGHMLRKDYPAALEASEEALKLMRSIQAESPDSGYCVGERGIAKLHCDDLAGAEADLREAIRISDKFGNGVGVASFTGYLAEVLLSRGDGPSAEGLATQALETSREVKDMLLMARNHHRLARVLLHLGRAAEARAHAQEAVAMFRELRFRALPEAEATLAACAAPAGSSSTRSV